MGSNQTLFKTIMVINEGGASIDGFAATMHYCICKQSSLIDYATDINLLFCWFLKASSWVGTKREDMLVPSNYIVTCNVAVT